MKIGLRTIKTAISATLAMILAERLGLLYPASAGIIAVLSVTNSKKTSLFTGLYRLFSLAVATFIAYACFTLFGFQPLAFGLYLLLFIPTAVYFKVSDGIVVSSVLVTHYLVEQDLSLAIIGNEFLLMSLGVGLALLMNLYMPDVEKRLKVDQEMIEAQFRRILTEMARYLNQHQKERYLYEQCVELTTLIRDGERWAQNYVDNRFLKADYYYLEYFAMRRMQSATIKEMAKLLEKIVVEPEQVANIQTLFDYTAETFSETNNGQEILERIDHVYAAYRQKELPQSRAEFENRAQLFQLLQLFEAFIETKVEFAKQQPKLTQHLE